MKSAGRNNSNTSSLDLGSPPQLQFAGALTMECWFKFENDDMKRIPQQIFYHGDGNYWTYLYVQSSTLYAGCNSPMVCSCSRKAFGTQRVHATREQGSTKGF